LITQHEIVHLHWRRKARVGEGTDAANIIRNFGCMMIAEKMIFLKEESKGKEEWSTTSKNTRLNV